MVTAAPTSNASAAWPRFPHVASAAAAQKRAALAVAHVADTEIAWK
jgi:hypothetical protein